MAMALEGDEGSVSCPGRSLPPGKTWYPLYRRLGGTQGWSGQMQKISPTHRDSIPDCPARSQSLYRLRYPAHFWKYTLVGNYKVAGINSAPVLTTIKCKCIREALLTLTPHTWLNCGIICTWPPDAWIIFGIAVANAWTGKWMVWYRVCPFAVEMGTWTGMVCCIGNCTTCGMLAGRTATFCPETERHTRDLTWHGSFHVSWLEYSPKTPTNAHLTHK